MKLDQWIKSKSQDPEYQRAAAEDAFTQDVADLVVHLRVQSGLSQVELASLAGTTQAAISRLESGIGNPTLSKLARVVDVLRHAEYVPALHVGLSGHVTITATTTGALTDTGEWPAPSGGHLQPLSTRAMGSMSDQLFRHPGLQPA